jgi:hypothetical protein
MEPCAICEHPNRWTIERAYFAGERVPDGFSRRAVEVHAAHLADPEALRMLLSLGGAAAIVARLRYLEQRAMDVLEAAMQADDASVALRAVREMRETVKVMAALGLHLAEDHGPQSVRSDLDAGIAEALRRRGVGPHSEGVHKVQGQAQEEEGHTQPGSTTHSHATPRPALERRNP